MMRAGVIPEGAQVELIEGLLIEMPADGPQHRQFTNDLAFWLYSILDQRKYTVLPNTTLVLSEDSAPSPDWSITPADIPMDAVRGSDSLLVIEQADSSLTRDLQSKAALYAAHGVRDYWVIDINAKTLHIHRDPTPEGYGFKQRFAADAGVEALLIPGLTLRLDALSRVG
jgi:Uma2 family endonuclease